MALELIYTSAPAGLDRHARGYCTVQRTQGLGSDLQRRLEGLCGLDLGALRGRSATEGVFLHTHMRHGTNRLNVIARLSPAGDDYSGRPNKVVHQLVLTAAECPPAGPAAVLAAAGLKQRWHGQPAETRPPAVPSARPSPPSTGTWKSVTGDAGWAGHVLKLSIQNPGQPLFLIVSDHADRLSLINELLSLLPAAQRWNWTFSTEYQTLPAGVSCQWRFVSRSSPVARSAAGGRIESLDFSGPVPDDSTGFVTAARQQSPVPFDSALRNGGRTVSDSSLMRQESSLRIRMNSQPVRAAGTQSKPASFRVTQPSPGGAVQPSRSSGAARSPILSDSQPSLTDSGRILAPSTASAPEPQQTFSRMHWPLVMAAMVVFLLACAVGTCAWWQHRETQKQEAKRQAEIQAHAEQQQTLFAGLQQRLDEAGELADTLKTYCHQLAIPDDKADAAAEFVARWLSGLGSVRQPMASFQESNWQQLLETAQQLDEPSRSQMTENLKLRKNKLDAADDQSQRIGKTLEEWLNLDKAVAKLNTRNEVQAFLERDSKRLSSVQQRLAALQKNIPELQFSALTNRIRAAETRLRRFAKTPQPVLLTADAIPAEASSDGSSVLTVHANGVDDISKVNLIVPVTVTDNNGKGTTITYEEIGTVLLEKSVTPHPAHDGFDIKVRAPHSFWQHPLSQLLQIRAEGRWYEQDWQFPEPLQSEQVQQLLAAASRAHFVLRLSEADITLDLTRKPASHLGVQDIRFGLPLPDLKFPNTTSGSEDAENIGLDNVQQKAAQAAEKLVEKVFSDNIREACTEAWLKTLRVDGNKTLRCEGSQTQFDHALNGIVRNTVKDLTDTKRLDDRINRLCELMPSMDKREAQKLLRPFAAQAKRLEDALNMQFFDTLDVDPAADAAPTPEQREFQKLVRDIDTALNNIKQRRHPARAKRNADNTAVESSETENAEDFPTDRKRFTEAFGEKSPGWDTEVDLMKVRLLLSPEFRNAVRSERQIFDAVYQQNFHLKKLEFDYRGLPDSLKTRSLQFEPPKKLSFEILELPPTNKGRRKSRKQSR